MAWRRRVWHGARAAAVVLAVALASAWPRGVVLAGEEAPAGPITTGQRVFTCGHSFHAPFVPKFLAAVAAAANIKGHEVVGVSMIGGSRVIQHWDVPDEMNKAKAALREGKVDVLTLSPIFLPDDGIDKFAELAVAHNPNVRITLQQSWLPYDCDDLSFPLKVRKDVDHNAATAEQLRRMHEPLFRAGDDYVRALNQRLGHNAVFIVPCGQALLALREKVIKGEAPGLKSQAELFRDGLGHPTVPLQALVVYCHFAVIYRQSPVGLPLLHPLGAHEHQDMQLNRLLEELAWDAVIHEPLSGVTAQGK